MSAGCRAVCSRSPALKANISGKNVGKLRGRRWSVAGAASMVATLHAASFPASSLASDEASASGQKGPAWGESTVGIDAASHYWSTYSGMTFAPFGAIREEGWRLRLQGGYGQYQYQAVRAVAGAPHLIQFRGIKSFGEVMAGYQLGLGALTLKAFAGAELESNTLLPNDPANPVNGVATGAKLAVETWLDLGPNGWAALDGAWGSAG